MRKLRENLIYALPSLLCFDAYCFFNIKSFPITLSFLAVLLILLCSIFTFKSYDSSLILSFLILIILIFVCSLTYSFNVTSSLLYIFYFFAFILSGHRLNETKYYKALKSLLFITTIFSVIAIFQMISCFTSLPRFDIIIPGHMVLGFNRSNLIYFSSNLIIARSNGLFLEPSYLSQYCVISFVIAITLYKAKLLKKRTMILTIIINSFGLLFSFAGTGLLLLIIFLIIYWFKHMKSLAGIYLIFALIFLGIIAFFALPDNLQSYLLARVTEVSDSNMSGGMRFTYPYYMVVLTFVYRIVGFGCGNEAVAMNQFYPEMLGMSEYLASGYAKVGVELGLLGLAIIIFAVFKCDKRRNIYLFVFLLMINVLGGNLINTYFWCFMMFFNYKETPCISEKIEVCRSHEKLKEVRTTV